MLTVSQALDAILREVKCLTPRVTPLDEALALVLAEEVHSDVDSPPFDKSLMDGFAVRSEDVVQSGSVLRVIEHVMAGQVPSKRVGAGEAAQIMTGAPIPAGADAVVPIERTEPLADSGTVRIVAGSARSGANIMRQASVMRAGQRMLGLGRTLRPQELGALAELGRAEVRVHPRPRVAVLATGDELVPIGQKPGPGQIRNSNEKMLVAQIRRAGGDPVPLGIAVDQEPILAERVEQGLASDMLLISGGVSAGKRDLVPAVLHAAGVREAFHKVDVRPGKPLWFGIKDGSPSDREGARGRCVVFGLPGNPVSSMVCFELFARTALRRLMGREPALVPVTPARLTAPCSTRGERPTYHPATIESDLTGCTVVTLVPWQGSSDVQSTVEANGMAVLPPGEHRLATGATIDVIKW